MPVWPAVEQSITESTGHAFSIKNQQRIGGGSINTACRIDDDGQSYFVKLNQADQLDMFVAEADGLRELAGAHAIRVPSPVCYGEAAGRSWLVAEFIAFGRGTGDSAQLLGQQLATMHGHTSKQFGWRRDNTIGSTPQQNFRTDNWVDFYRERRLRFQFELVARNGFSGLLQTKGERLMESLGVFFTSYMPEASLLHGDLWGGNRAFDATGQPVIFDPAVYYGDREADIAMTELFGGFGADFYAAYREAWPLDAGYSVRKTLYNLYHILNHANLFGGGYASQAENMIDQLLAEI